MKLMGYLLMAAMGSAPLVADLPIQNDQVISLLNITEEMIQEFSEGNMGHLIVECPEGASMPFHISVQGQFLGLDPATPMPFDLKILKTCYIRCEESQNFLFSTDLQTWQGFSEFFTGSLKVLVHVKDGGLTAGLELELNQQE